MCDYSSDEEPVGVAVRSAAVPLKGGAARLVQSTLKGGVAGEEGPKRAGGSPFPGKQRPLRQTKL